MAGSARWGASRPLLVGLLAVAVLLGLGGCTLIDDGDGDPEGTSAPTEQAPTGAAATNTQAAELRAALTYHLTVRVHLVLEHSRTLRTAAGRRDDAAVVAARRAVSTSAEATVDVLTASYAGARDELGPALRAHDSALLAHTELLVTERGDPVAGLARLDQRREELARALRKVVPRLRAQDIEGALSAQTAATLDAVAALVAGSGREPALQRTAADAAWSTARLLSVGVAADRGLGLAGSPAAELRSRLTGLLTEHVLLAGALASRVHAANGDLADPGVQAAAAALDASAVSLAELAGRSVPEAAQPVLAAWREHLREVQDHAVARATGQAPAPTTGDYLSRLQAALGPQAGNAPPRGGQVGEAAAASLRAALDAAATGDSTAPEAVRRAAADTPAVGALVAATLAEQLQLR